MRYVLPSKDHYSEKSIYLSVALISMSVLMLEIGLIRFFSVMFDSHYAFLLISLGILGLGTGGIYVHFWAANKSNKSVKLFQEILPFSSGLMAIAIIGITILMVKLSFFHHILTAALIAFVPFFFGGVFIAGAFRLFPDRCTKVYAADLIGASLGSWLIVLLLKLGGINVNMLVALISSLPAVILIFKGSIKSLKVGFSCLGLALISIFFLNYSGNFLGSIPLTNGAHKEMAYLLTHPVLNGSIIESRWSAFGRTDLLENKLDPNELVFYIDGNAGTGMYRLDEGLSLLDSPTLKNFPGHFPFKLLPAEEKEKVLIIGPGGGRDVLISLLGGAKEITAVEVNPDLVDLMKKYSDFNGGIYNGFPGVKVVVEEGRNFIRATKNKYDIIMLSIPITKGSRSPDGFALTENFLFTVESINDYLNRLKKNGRLIVIAHDTAEIMRLTLLSLSALQKKGIDSVEAMKQIYTVGSEKFPVFVLKKSPLTPSEAQNVHLKMHEHNYISRSTFIPFIEQVKHITNLDEEINQEHFMFNQALYLMAEGEISPDELIHLANMELKAVTDDNPFFYKFEIGIPPVLTILIILSLIALCGAWAIRPKYTEGVNNPRNNIFFLVLFSLLGIGFMLIEISLFQKFILFLGQPVYSAAMLLFSILIGAGIGSWTSGALLKRKTLFKLRCASLIAGLIVIAYTLFLKEIFSSFLGTPFNGRLLISFLLLAPLGFFLGMPFPLGMQLLDEAGLEEFVPKMWGVNGIGSVLGSALSIALAISFGFSYALVLGAILYIFVFILFSMGLLTVASGGSA